MERKWPCEFPVQFKLSPAQYKERRYSWSEGLKRASGTCGTEVPKGSEVGVGVGAGRMASPASHRSLYSSALYFLPLNVLSPSSIPSTRIFLLLLL